MRIKIDLQKKRFGRLTVLKDSGERTAKGEVYWTCRCDCGNTTSVMGGNLRRGTIVSCGCFAREQSAKRRRAAKKPPRVCKIPECTEFASKGGFGLCGKHYARFKRHGDIEYVTSELERRILTRQAQPKLGKVAKNTYRKLLGKHEHRRMVEQFIGRRLLPTEIVHHVDENKHNNDISNLQIVNRSEHAKIHFWGKKK